MSKNLGTKFLLLAAGVAAGAVVGILFAPDEGRNTRDRLTFRLSRYREKLAELIGQIKEVQEAVSSEAKAESEKVIAETKQEAERLLGHVEALMDQIKEQKSGI
jgi:gas vesicle protein